VLLLFDLLHDGGDDTGKSREERRRAVKGITILTRGTAVFVSWTRGVAVVKTREQ